jgi:DNA helicase-2/ATP-dependent DNA helicase PcrA
VVIGPPGTGKTSRLLRYLLDLIERGIPPGRIAFLSFTRGARDEARQRVSELFGLTPDELTWFRTIHSTAYALLKLKPDQVMADAPWHEFGIQYGYGLSDFECRDEDGPLDLPRRTREDMLRFASSWGANRRLGVVETLRCCPVDISPVHYPLFAERLRAFKHHKGLLDFSDMLERVLEHGLRPDVDFVFLDEAQDLSPLQIAAVEMWFEPCREVYVAGDDDQAVYGFQGAEPDWLLQVTGRHPSEVLAQSYRVPAAAFSIARSCSFEMIRLSGVNSAPGNRSFCACSTVK